jgi:hypothetical protein
MDCAQAMAPENSRVTTAEIVAKFGISAALAHAILHNEMKFTRVCSRWVPKLLTDQLKQNHGTVC